MNVITLNVGKGCSIIHIIYTLVTFDNSLYYYYYEKKLKKKKFNFFFKNIEI